MGASLHPCGSAASPLLRRSGRLPRGRRPQVPGASERDSVIALLTLASELERLCPTVTAWERGGVVREFPRVKTVFEEYVKSV